MIFYDSRKTEQIASRYSHNKIKLLWDSEMFSRIHRHIVLHTLVVSTQHDVKVWKVEENR